MTETTTATAPVAEKATQSTKKAASGKPSNGAAKSVKKGAKKAATKKGAKAPQSTKKAATKKAPAATKEKKDGLRKPQERILKLLSKGKQLTRPQIAEKAPVDAASCTEYLGSTKDDIREENDKKHFPSLVTLGYVKIQEMEDGIYYAITAKGTAVANKLE